MNIGYNHVWQQAEYAGITNEPELFIQGGNSGNHPFDRSTATLTFEISLYDSTDQSYSTQMLVNTRFHTSPIWKNTQYFTGIFVLEQVLINYDNFPDREGVKASNECA